MQKELNQIRKEIKLLKEKESKLVLELIKQKAKEKDTYKIPGVTKTTWLKLPNQLSRSALYRRKKKLSTKALGK